MTGLDRNELMKWIPHRDPFLLIDHAEDFQAGESLTGVKNVTPDEPYFPGHFPGKPVMPGVLILEAMAQTGAALAAKSLDVDPASGVILFATVERARFRRPVAPGDTLKLPVKLLNTRHGLYKFQGEAWVGENKAAEASFAAKFVEGAR